MNEIHTKLSFDAVWLLTESEVVVCVFFSSSFSVSTFVHFTVVKKYIRTHSLCVCGIWNTNDLMKYETCRYTTTTMYLCEYAGLCVCVRHGCIVNKNFYSCYAIQYKDRCIKARCVYCLCVHEANTAFEYIHAQWMWIMYSIRTHHPPDSHISKLVVNKTAYGLVYFWRFVILVCSHNTYRQQQQQQHRVLLLKYVCYGIEKT